MTASIADRYDVLDCHQHVGAVFGIPFLGLTDTTSADGLADDRTLRFECMDHAGVRQTLLMPGHSYPKPNGLADTRIINDRLAAYQRAAPDRIAGAIGTLEPRYGTGAIAEIERMRFELGFPGVSWHHRQQALPMDHPVMQAFLRRMAEIGGLVPFIHCYTGADFEELWRLRRLAEMFPELTFLALDTMTNPAQFEQALAVGEGAPNVMLDTTSSVMGPEGVERLVERLGPTRLLFGTNLYSGQRKLEFDELDDVIAADISEDDKAMILGGNARRLFGFS